MVDIRQIINNAKKTVDEYNRFPMKFLDRGKKVTFRLICMEGLDHGFARTSYMHMVNKAKSTCLAKDEKGEGCPICEKWFELEKLTKDKYYGRRFNAFLPVYIIEQGKDPYFAILVLKFGAFIEVNEIISKLTEDQARDFLSATTPFPALTLSVSDDGRDVVAGFESSDLVTVPSVPSDFPDVNKVWYSQTPSEEGVVSVVNELTKEIGKLSGVSVGGVTNITSGAGGLPGLGQASQPANVEQPSTGLPFSIDDTSLTVGKGAISNLPGLASTPAETPATGTAMTPNPSDVDSEGRPKCFTKAWQICADCVQCQFEEDCKKAVKGS